MCDKFFEDLFCQMVTNNVFNDTKFDSIPAGNRLLFRVIRSQI